MADKKTYRVLRPMDGDRFYRPGELREMFPIDAANLLRLGALEALADDGDEERQKSEGPVPEDKIEGAPANKAEVTSKAKG
ncbi:hypothetical protein [Azospirillum tabaci]|uniref:hypothetical protein n=1 Tax=Azospirillum tabaci TaxID=2752310 RepID=UPI0016611707|nr:hypothetical protein [Azospirillum tabaci]